MGREFSRNSQSYTEARSSFVGEQQRKAANRRRIERFVSIGILVAGALSVGGGFVIDKSSANKIESEINPQIAILEEELEQKKKNIDTNASGHVVRYEDAVVNSALDKGSLLCEYQNTLSKYTLNMRKTGNSKLSEEHQKLLETYRALIVDPPANMKGTWCEFGTWQFDSTFDFEGTRMQVVWRCYDGDELLAVVMGTYDAELGRFYDMQLLKTIYYQQAVIDIPVVTTAVTTGTGEVVVTTHRPGETDIISSNDDTTRVPDDPDITIISSDSDTTTSVIGPDDPYVTSVTTVTTVTSTLTSPQTVYYEYPEDQWFYGWSVEYQCWGYFDSSGNFMTEDEYQNYFGW